jgi:hypothetical protein
MRTSFDAMRQPLKQLRRGEPGLTTPFELLMRFAFAATLARK